ncbi:MAG: PspC domain-containing protein [Actinomycetota bacterium]|nr:PspC domain-containing protein [Actinomycetota bacterium]
MARGQLRRSTTDRKIAGVAGGIAAYLGMDATLVRVIWALVIILPGGFGLIPYIILWIALPEGDPGSLGSRSPALEIAEERYARGEISAEDLSRIREDLSR